MGRVVGQVVDANSGLPLANADVDIGPTTRVRTRADGSFEATVPAGRLATRVGADDFLPHRRDLVVGENPVPVVMKMVRRAVAQPVGRQPTTVSTEEATLDVTADTYPDGATVAVTSISRRRLSAVPAPVQFIDVGGAPRRVLSSISVDSSAPPQRPVRLRVPVATEITTDAVKLYLIDALGVWAEVGGPESITMGVATFVLPGDGHYGVAIDVRRAPGARVGYVVVDSGDLAMAEGDVIGADTEVATTRRPVSLVDPLGNRIDVAPASRIRTEPPAQETGSFSAKALASELALSDMTPFAGRITVEAGTARVVVAGHINATSSAPLKLQTHLQYIHVGSGAALTLSVEDCGKGFFESLEVVAGSAETTVLDRAPRLIAAGSVTTICKDCGKGAAAKCEAGLLDASIPPLAASDGSVGQSDAASGDGPRIEDARSTTFALAVDPIGGLFGGIAVGTVATMTFTVVNTGDSDLPPIVVRIIGMDASEFLLHPSPCTLGTTSLRPRDSCSFDVDFRPSSEGDKNGTIEVTAGTLASSTGPLRGTGTPGSPRDTSTAPTFDATRALSD